jgi:hypothetical protein
MKTNWPTLAAKYTRSESLEDVLFRVDFNHVENYATGDGPIPLLCDSALHFSVLVKVLRIGIDLNLAQV